MRWGTPSRVPVRQDGEARAALQWCGMSPSFEPARQRVLSRYGSVVAGLRWESLGSGGGFSGAHVWRGEDDQGSPLFALKAWPTSESLNRVERVHGWMAQAAHLPFVPAVL